MQALREFLSSACAVLARFCIQRLNYTQIMKQVKRNRVKIVLELGEQTPGKRQEALDILEIRDHPHRHTDRA
jgi:hypothetical protein